MATKVEFKFDIDQRVQTNFGDVGLVESIAADDGGKKYWVVRDNESKWFKEKNLSSVE